MILSGVSGSGKTTLIRLISGLAPSQYPGKITGSVLVGGNMPTRMASHDKAVMFGMVFQDPRSQFFMSNVRNEIAFTGENLGFEPTDILSKIARIASRLGLVDVLKRDLDSLSSGQKQKVAIAAACLLNPALLVLDEPTANLDHGGVGALVEILKEIKRGGTTILIGEHRVHELLSVVDHIVCLRDGRVAKEWNVEKFQQMNCQDAEGYGLRHPDSGKAATRDGKTGSDTVSFHLEQVSFRYSKHASVFEDLSFSLERGRVTAILGENGVGKTTLGKTLCGILRQREGRIVSGGRVLSVGKRRRKSYFVMQDADYQLYSDSVGNELVLGRRVTDDLRKRAYAAMDLFGLTPLKDRHPASLSGGEKQRVTIAAAYCSKAELVVLDEPTSGLDVVNAQRVARFVRMLAQEGKTVVVITHDELLLRLACDRVVEIGRVS